MKLSLSVRRFACRSGFERELPECIACARQVGCDGVEIRRGHLDETSPSVFRGLKRIGSAGYVTAMPAAYPGVDSRELARRHHQHLSEFLA